MNASWQKEPNRVFGLPHVVHPRYALSIVVEIKTKWILDRTHLNPKQMNERSVFVTISSIVSLLDVRTPVYLSSIGVCLSLTDRNEVAQCSDQRAILLRFEVSGIHREIVTILYERFGHPTSRTKES